MPVYDFDANRNGVLNEHHPEPPWRTSYCIDDNLETLCGFYYGCRIGGCDPGNPNSADCANIDPSLCNLRNDDDWKEWYECCIVKVCGCPKQEG
jgi:hypothetical protein